MISLYRLFITICILQILYAVLCKYMNLLKVTPELQLL